ncbi:MAG: hypothetical protein ACT6SF_00390 [Hydrogenophaga sp.]|jgi:hypothetical protein|uniref:hypothetical protein n=1 Tax=Hydrogenophaga sp. TaxID=1904254 RepID=UPI001D748F00|nr:hypothetical protein [Hydrogenophaga sp.]MBW0170710.1 hypothetical protein [Hydrogenophaga sp.]MBW0185547.1 hypothetical protein [Hydrogenophaga sp.]
MTNTCQRLISQDVKKARWAAADKQRPSWVYAECKCIGLGLSFLKYFSAAFDGRRRQLLPPHYKYSPDRKDEATKMVLWRVESLSAEWAIA